MGYRRRMADVMRIGAGLLGLKIENMHATAAASRFLRGQGSHGDAKESLGKSGPEHFWGHFGVILGSLWDHFGI